MLRKCSDLWILDKTGFMGYMYRSWKRDLRIDSQSSTLHRKEIKWAHDKGFFSYRIKQYGLTDDNYSEFLSDREYRWLRPINCEYRKWVYDKVSFRSRRIRFRFKPAEEEGCAGCKADGRIEGHRILQA